MRERLVAIFAFRTRSGSRYSTKFPETPQANNTALCTTQQYVNKKRNFETTFLRSVVIIIDDYATFYHLHYCQQVLFDFNTWSRCDDSEATSVSRNHPTSKFVRRKIVEFIIPVSGRKENKILRMKEEKQNDSTNNIMIYNKLYITMYVYIKRIGSCGYKKMTKNVYVI